MPYMSDLLLYRTFSAIDFHKQKKTIDFPFDPPVKDNFKPPVSQGQLNTFIDGLADSTSATSSTPAPAGALTATFQPIKQGTLKNKLRRIQQEFGQDVWEYIPHPEEE